MLINVLSLVVSVVALAGVYYTWKQVDLLRKDSQEKKVWATKHSEAFTLVLETNKWIIVKPSVNTNGYPRVFADHAFRVLVETYIIQMDWSKNMMTPRVLDADQFALPIVQEVIRKTIETVERFKKEHPEEAHDLGLI